MSRPPSGIRTARIRRTASWSGEAQTFDVFEELAASQSTGIRMREVKELFRTGEPDPWWMHAVRQIRHCDATELPAGFVDGFVFTTPVVEMPIYLTYLMRRFQAGGGVIEQRDVGVLADVASDERVIVHCAGVGAKGLAPDSVGHADPRSGRLCPQPRYRPSAPR